MLGPRLYAGYMPDEGKAPASNPKLHVLQTSAIHYLCVSYIVEPANSEHMAQPTHMEDMKAVDISRKTSSST